ncbi:hypothetical protein SPRG_12777 [Saprolegnia parasitica CBS 223.65]|uniref:Uncharacterized protein n=1 Tax=Saprolegnia parasitica (strain CBS 223.65) TaxID=695850 RepID=A0A067BZN8_SAPPC|nr:hypothetical protein SPRG_12777 [Saprolegnia parasitica CBS 223.65]KDO22315.1 hypothetical protein SPRG_12777 [Saprolegnia parasitica CBS 223.65]|eukprot:XP_012206951.1 hypothetical protein SPRG_12777 [Saprolegnia parasitica CBS 223.65]
MLNESDKQLIRSLLASNKDLTTNLERLGQRVGDLTDQLAAGGDELAERAPRPNAKRAAETEIVGSKPVEKKPKATRAASMAMAKTWYTWFVGTPAMYTAEWDASNGNRQHKNQTKTVVAFMRLFATEGYVLRADAPHYKSLVTEIGERLEARCKAFLQEHNLSAASASPVAKAFRELRDSGALDDKAAMTARLLATGIIVDPSPPSMHATAMAKNAKKTQSQTKT